MQLKVRHAHPQKQNSGQELKFVVENIEVDLDAFNVFILNFGAAI